MRKLLAVVLAFAPAAHAAPVDIGVASAVRGSVKAVAPGAAGRVVETGKPVYSHDKVTTGPEGKLQVLLLDQTSFTMGANSEMELDEFVFDPATNVGKVSAKIAKGAFRFVTGKVARRDPSAMKVTTPVGTIGIRGTMTAGQVSDTEGTFVLLGPGPENNADEKAGGITVKNDKGATEVDKDGWGVNVKAGEAPSPAFELGAGQLEGILNGVGSSPKGDSKDEQTAGKSTDEQSGQGTAAGKSNASDAFAAVDSAQGDVSQFASQQFAAPRTATWDEVRGVASGSGKYMGTAQYFICSAGGGCGTTAQGTMTFSMNIDFANKTFGGGGSNIDLPGVAGVNGSIVSTSYAALTGDAKTSLTMSGAGDWTGTTLKLINAGGVPAGQASIDVRWQTNTGPVTNYGGPISGPLQ